MVSESMYNILSLCMQSEIFLVTLSCSHSLLLSAGAIQVGYEFTQYTTSEGAGVIELCAIISVPASGVAPREFVIEANTRDGSAGTNNT